MDMLGTIGTANHNRKGMAINSAAKFKTTADWRDVHTVENTLETPSPSKEPERMLPKRSSDISEKRVGLVQRVKRDSEETQGKHRKNSHRRAAAV